MITLKAFDQFAKGKLETVKRKNTCVIYTRVSTKEQADNNKSLDIQRKACEQFAKKNNYLIMAYFGGTYESAKTDERKEFNNMQSHRGLSRGVCGLLVFPPGNKLRGNDEIRMTNDESSTNDQCSNDQNRAGFVFRHWDIRP